jgi:hypothetical protein
MTWRCVPLVVPAEVVRCKAVVALDIRTAFRSSLMENRCVVGSEDEE